MTTFDLAIEAFLGRFADRSPIFDSLVATLANSDIVKSGLFVGFLCWTWFRRCADQPERRKQVITCIAGVLVAMAVSRILTTTLPFTPRPLTAASVTVPPPTVARASAEWAHGHSSFPSDHMSLAFSMAVGIFFISPRLGILCMVYAVLFIGLPRLYLGAHWLTDILAGMAVGAVTAWIANLGALRERVSRPFLRWVEHSPESFYALAFLLVFEIMTRLYDLREMGNWILSALGHGPHHHV